MLASLAIIHAALYATICILYVGAALASLREGRHRHALREFGLALAYVAIAVTFTTEDVHLAAPNAYISSHELGSLTIV